MFKRMLPLALVLSGMVSAVAATPPLLKWPPWLSIESPVNPFDASARGAALLVHASFREGVAQLSDVSGTAEGLVNGARRSVPLRFDTTGLPGVFAVRRQWPAEGRWLLRISLKTTTALVELDRSGLVASVRVPTQQQSGLEIPRAVGRRDVDSTLAAMSTR